MRSRWRGWCVAGLLTTHALLVGWSAARHSPVVDEMGHLPAGISHWQFRQFTLYKVNPPLVRMAAAVPTVFARPKTEWLAFSADPLARPEFFLGEAFIEVNGTRAFDLFTWARWACLPFTVLGGWACYRWARSLHGDGAGLLAAALWCTCPNVIGYAQLIVPDLGAAAVGLVACWVFRRWLATASWRNAMLAGLLLGAAQLTKFTLLILVPLWPALWVAVRLGDAGFRSPREIGRQLAQLAFLAVLGVWVINVGYAFEGAGERLGEFRFVSDAFSGPAGKHDLDAPAVNRFTGSRWGALPVPLPRNYVLGIDRQKLDLETKWWSYLRGEWRMGGWWYYYLYALAVKVPLGTWLLAAVALAAAASSQVYRRHWQEEIQLLVPIAAVLALVSSQTGFNHHLRYVLPIFPFAFIAISRLGRAFEGRQPVLAGGVAVLLGCSAASSLWAYPHGLSYFNELAGGPRNGYKHLAHSNTDWGQDVLLLKQWVDRHPEARPFALAMDIMPVIQSTLGLPSLLPTVGPASDPPPHPAQLVGPYPGWYAVSVNRLYDRRNEYTYFRRYEPVARAGYSIHVYHLSLEEANRGRRELGLPELIPRPKDSGPQ